MPRTAAPPRTAPSKPAGTSAKAATKKATDASTVVIFVRHGQTPTTGAVLPGRARGLHLSDVGRAQAEAVAAHLAAMPRIDAVYASPLERTKETARPIAEARGLAVRIERGLLECDFGEWTGAKLKLLMKKPEWATVQRHPTAFRFPGGESFLEMQARMASTVAGLCERHRGGVVVAVSHADPIKAAVADAMGTHLDLFQRIVISPCSISTVAYGRTGTSVINVNTTVPVANGSKP